MTFHYIIGNISFWGGHPWWGLDVIIHGNGLAINEGAFIYIEMDGFCTTFESQNLEILSNVNLFANCTSAWWPLVIIVLSKGIILNINSHFVFGPRWLIAWTFTMCRLFPHHQNHFCYSRPQKVEALHLSTLCNLHFPSWLGKPLKKMGVFENKHNFAILRGESKTLFYQGNQKGAIDNEKKNYHVPSLSFFMLFWKL